MLPSDSLYNQNLSNVKKSEIIDQILASEGNEFSKEELEAKTVAELTALQTPESNAAGSLDGLPEAAQKVIANMQNALNQLKSENESLKKDSAKYQKALDQVRTQIGEEAKKVSAPKSEPCLHKDFTLELKDAKGEVRETQKYVVKEIGKKQNKIHNPITNQFTSLSSLIDQAKEGNPSVLLKIIEDAENSKTKYKFLPFAPEED